MNDYIVTNVEKYNVIIIQVNKDTPFVFKTIYTYPQSQFSFTVMPTIVSSITDTLSKNIKY